MLAASVAAILYNIYSPSVYSAVEPDLNPDIFADDNDISYVGNLVNTFPDNIFGPFIEGKVLSVLFVALLFGAAINHIQKGRAIDTIVNFFNALQQMLFVIVNWLIKILPIGIFGFITQCVAEFKTGVDLKGLGGYFATVITANLVQMFVVLPLFLLCKKLNPLKVFKGMMTALTVAFFSKSSAATLPVTLASAEQNVKVNPRVSRFVLPICTTINMNGCAAFILVTSLFVMQNSGMELTMGSMISWLFVAVLAAIGNAGVPMGCYFLTLSLMSSVGASIGIMGVILPIYTIIDMIETAENVWSDSCVCAMTNKDLKGVLEED